VRRVKKVKKAAGWVLFAALAAMVLWFAAPYYIGKQVDKALSSGLTEQLGVETSVEYVDVNLPGRAVSVYGFKVKQPQGYGKGSLVYVPELRLVFSADGLFSGRYRIENAELTGCEFQVRTLTNAQSSIDALIATIEQKAGGRKKGAEPSGFRWLHIDSFAVHDAAFDYHEKTSSGRIIELEVDGIDGLVSNLRFQPGRQLPGPAAHLQMSGDITGGLYSRGKCGLVAELGAIGDATPAFNLSFQVVGFELALIEPALPPRTAALLGGDALDGFIQLSGDSDFVSGEAVIKMVAGHTYRVGIEGRGEAPEVSLQENALATVIKRSSGGVGALLKDVGAAGGSVIKGAADVATGLAEGTAKTVGSFGSGLLETAKGVVTLDGSDLGSGVKEMGAALTGGAKDAVFTAGGGIMEGAGEITGSLTGSERAIKWRRSIQDRWTNSWQSAMEWVRSRPFPPQVPRSAETNNAPPVETNAFYSPPESSTRLSATPGIDLRVF
jgi:hypothetical protein